MSQEGRIVFAKTCRILVGLLHNAIEVVKTSPEDKFSCVKNWKLDAVLETIEQMWEQESSTDVLSESKEKEQKELPHKEEPKKEPPKKEQTKKDTPKKDSIRKESLFKKDSKIEPNKDKEAKEEKEGSEDKDKEDKDNNEKDEKDEKEEESDDVKSSEKPLDHRKILMQSHLQIQIQNALTMEIKKAPDKNFGLKYIIMKSKISVYKIILIFRLCNFFVICLMT